jgi:hypothetical protein
MSRLESRSQDVTTITAEHAELAENNNASARSARSVVYVFL